MRNKYIAGIFCVFVLLSASGCSSDAEAKTQPKDYEDLIGTVKDCIADVDLDKPWDCDFSFSIIAAGSTGTPGYLIEDIDGNGVDELIFGVNETNPELLPTWDGVIYNIYTISGGALVPVLNGWERNRYYLCENGMIANEGSSGAGNFSYTYFTFEESKLHLVESVIYDGMKDRDNPWFYSTESVTDAENAEPISEERAKEIREKYTYEHPEFVPFTGGI